MIRKNNRSNLKYLSFMHLIYYRFSNYFIFTLIYQLFFIIYIMDLISFRSSIVIIINIEINQIIIHLSFD